MNDIDNGTGRRERGNLVFLGLMAIFLTWLYGYEGNAEETLTTGHSAVGWLVGRWNWAGADMSHGWLIPWVSVYAIWQMRSELRMTRKSVSWAGLGVVVVALLLYLAGLRVQQTRIVMVSLIVLAWGIPAFLYGWSIAKQLIFPCFYLVFCIPMTFLDGLTLPLRLISTTVSAGLLNGLGISVTRIGTAIHVNAGAGFSMDVAHPCSGLRYLLAMVALTTAYAYFTQRTTLKRGILCVASIPLAMTGNIVRIVMIAVVGSWFGPKLALGFYHDYSGYVVFAVAILMMIGVGNLLNRTHSNPGGIAPAGTGKGRGGA